MSGTPQTNLLRILGLVLAILFYLVFLIGICLAALCFFLPG
ncbi:hypothetical protein [Ktedonospora formicarum]|nr:hypothetical protein [Ktedonospora formicarum]